MKVSTVILPESIARLDTVKKQLARYSLDFQFVSAFDGRKMSEEAKRARCSQRSCLRERVSE